MAGLHAIARIRAAVTAAMAYPDPPTLEDQLTAADVANVDLDNLRQRADLLTALAGLDGPSWELVVDRLQAFTAVSRWRGPGVATKYLALTYAVKAERARLDYQTQLRDPRRV